MVVDEHPIHRVRQEAARCERCRDQGLVFRHDDGRWALPLFHKDATCPSRIVFPVGTLIARNCRPWLERLIVAAEARVVVTWGGVALAGTRNVEPHKLELRESVGKLHPWFGRLLLPLYHPGLLARKNRSTVQQFEDISCLKNVLQQPT